MSGREWFKGRSRLLFVGRARSRGFRGVSGDDNVRVYSRCHSKTTKYQALMKSMARRRLMTRTMESSRGEHGCVKYLKKPLLQLHC